jgi:hypothetical protein
MHQELQINMKLLLFLSLCCSISLNGCCQVQKSKTMSKSSVNATCNDNCEKQELTCKLTSKELQQRKETIIASIKRQILEKKELESGYSYKFAGSDSVVDSLSEFIKTERLCCDFFDFGLNIKGNASTAWLTITGPKGAKQFIASELGL